MVIGFASPWFFIRLGSVGSRCLDGNEYLNGITISSHTFAIRIAVNEKLDYLCDCFNSATKNFEHDINNKLINKKN